jgi:hypothetical protein
VRKRCCNYSGGSGPGAGEIARSLKIDVVISRYLMRIHGNDDVHRMDILDNAKVKPQKRLTIGTHSMENTMFVHEV